MEVIENQVTTGKTIAIDEKHFVNCRYTNCTLIYNGGEFGWANTTFENCQLALAGAAQRTANFLGNLGLLPPVGAVPTPKAPFGFPSTPSGPVQ